MGRNNRMLRRLGDKRISIATIAAAIGLLWASATVAGQQIGIEYGPSLEIDSSYYRHAESLRLNYNHTLGEPLTLLFGIHAQPRWELSVDRVAVTGSSLDSSNGYWEAAARVLFDFPLSDDPRLFVQVGTGPAYLSSDRLGPKWLGSRLDFRTHLGLGLRFGPSRAYDLIVAFSHISNAGLSHHNPGENFLSLKLDRGF